MTEDFKRQRRNILIMSCLLCFMKYGGILIKKTAVLGVEIEFSNTEAIYTGVWLLWIYFFIRFLQYFLQEGLPNIKYKIADNHTKIFRNKIKTIILEKFPDLKGYSSQMFDYDIMKKVNFYTIKVGGSGYPIESNINLWLLRKELMKSYVALLIGQSILMDCLFPFLFSLFTIVYTNINWDGALYKLLF